MTIRPQDCQCPRATDDVPNCFARRGTSVTDQYKGPMCPGCNWRIEKLVAEVGDNAYARGA